MLKPILLLQFVRDDVERNLAGPVWERKGEMDRTAEFSKKSARNLVMKACVTQHHLGTEAHRDLYDLIIPMGKELIRERCLQRTPFQLDHAVRNLAVGLQ